MVALQPDADEASIPLNVHETVYLLFRIAYHQTESWKTAPRASEYRVSGYVQDSIDIHFDDQVCQYEIEENFLIAGVQGSVQTVGRANAGRKSVTESDRCPPLVWNFPGPFPQYG